MIRPGLCDEASILFFDTDSQLLSSDTYYEKRSAQQKCCYFLRVGMNNICRKVTAKAKSFNVILSSLPMYFLEWILLPQKILLYQKTATVNLKFPGNSLLTYMTYYKSPKQ